MNMKTTKFLAVLAVFAMAFAVVAVAAPAEAVEATGVPYVDQAVKMNVTIEEVTTAYGYDTVDAAIKDQSSEAFNEAAEFEIILMKDATLAADSTLGGKTTFDLNGHVMTANYFVQLNGEECKIDGTDAGSKIIRTEKSGESSYVFKNQYSTKAADFTVDGGEYVNTASAGYFFNWEYGNGGGTPAGNAKAIFKNAIITAPINAIWSGNLAGGAVTIEGCTITTMGDGVYKGEKYYGVGIYLGCVNSATVKECTITSSGTGIEIKSGPVTIEGCTIVSNHYSPATGDINTNGSGSGESALNINNGYLNNTTATATTVEVKTTSLTNTVPGAPTVVITAGLGTDATETKRTVTFKADSSVSIDDIEVACAKTNPGKLAFDLTEDVEVISGNAVTSDSFKADEENIVVGNAALSAAVTIPAGAEVIIPLGATLTGDTTTNTLTINDTSRIVSTGGTIIGKVISGATNYITTADGNLSGDFIIEKGSVSVNGVITSASTILVGGDIEIEGSAIAAITIKADAATANLSFGNGFEAKLGLTIDVNGKDVTIAEDSLIIGSVIFTDSSSTTTSSVKLAADFTATGTISNTVVTTFTVNSSNTDDHTMAATTITGLTKGDHITFATVYEDVVEVSGVITEEQIKNSSIFVLVDNAILNFDLPEGKTIYLNGYGLTIAESLKVTKAKVIEGGYQGYTNEGGYVFVMNNKVLTLDTADIIADITLGTDASVNVAVAKTQTIDGQTISDVAVGYGNTLTIRNLTFESGNSVKAFGTLIIEGTTIVGAGAELIVAASGQAFVNGSLSIAGTATIEGQMTISGTVTVNGLSNKDATFLVTSEIDADDEDDFGVLVLSGGKFALLAPSNKTYHNYLAVSYDVNAFVVYGELNLNGTFAGAITDRGDVKVNGESELAIIYIFNDISLTITSVTGMLAVTDAGAAAEEMGSMTSAYYSDGNAICLTNVKAVTIYDTVNTKVSTEGEKYFWADMYIGGVVSSTAAGEYGSIVMDASVTSSKNNEPIGTSKSTARYGQIYVPELLTLGEKVSLTLNEGTIVVDGAVYALAANSGITAEEDSILKVNGSISIGLKAEKYEIDGNGKINAAYVTITDATTADKTGIYAALDNIVSDIASYDDKKITIFGTVSSYADFELKYGESIIVYAKATLTLKGDVKVAEGATINNSGDVKVSNYLYAANFAGSLIGNAAVSDVVVSEGIAKTLMSLARAIKEGMKEITLANDVTISSDMTIPEDVVVLSNGKTISISKEKTLTVDGGIVMSTGTPALGTDSKIIVNGYLMTKSEFKDAYAKLEGAHFSTKVNGETYNVISNITYATLLCGSGTITVYGHLSAGDIVLTKDSKAADLKIVITNISTDKLSSLTVSSLTLVGSSLDLETSDGVFNGTVAGLYGAGTDYAEIAFSDARGVTVSTSAVEKPAGMEYALLIKGTVYGATDGTFGKIAIADGIVTLDGDLTATGKNVILVTLGATLAVENHILTTGAATADVNLTNFGTISIDGGKLAIVGTLANYGDIYAESNDTDAVLVTGVLYNLGGIVMSEETGKVAKMKIGSVNAAKVIVGEKPEELGAVNAYITGYVNYGNDASYIIAYPGADLSEAKIAWNEGLGVDGVITSDLMINSEVYMTILVKDSQVKFNTIISKEKFELIGLVTSDLNTISKWYSDIAMSDKLDENDLIKESIPAVYAYAPIAKVYGTITEGVGLKIFVDGKNLVGGDIGLSIGTHKVFYELQAGYDGTDVTVMFNGKAVPVTASGLVIDITVDMYEYTLSATGATPIPEPEPVTPEEKSEWTVTTILLCVLVVLIAIMAVIVALRLNRN